MMEPFSSLPPSCAFPVGGKWAGAYICRWTGFPAAGRAGLHSKLNLTELWLKWLYCSRPVMWRWWLNFHFLTAFFIPSRLRSVICVLESTGFLPCHDHSKSNHFLIEIRKPLTWARGAASTTFQFPKISAVTLLKKISSSTQCGKSSRFYSIHSTNIYWWSVSDTLLVTRTKKKI